MILGAVVSLQEKWSKNHRWPLIAVFALLGMAGIWASNQQSVKSAKDNSAASAKLETSLTNLQTATAQISRLQSLNTELQQRLLASSRTVTELSKETLAQTTGGDTFPDILPLMMPDPCGGLPLAVVAQGKHNLLDLSVNVKEHMQRTDPASVSASLYYVRGASLPMVLANHLEELPICIHPEGDLDVYQIDTRARNGNWVEVLSLKRNGAGWISERTVSDLHGHTFLKLPK